MLQHAPYLNAVLNLICLYFLIRGRIAIAYKNKELHIKCMKLSLLFSFLFLISYVTYHLNYPSKPFEGLPWVRSIFLFILVSHIALCFTLPPLVISTLYFAWKEKWSKHKTWAKITFPIWVYISVTGVLIVIFSKFISN